MSWPEQRMVGFDLETTAPEPEEARIVTATIAYVGGDEAVETRGWVVNPGVEIPAEATAIHGVTNEFVELNGMDARSAVMEIAEELRRVVADYPLVIFNARYDLTVLDRELRRYGWRGLGNKGLTVIDPLVIDKHLDRYRKGSRKLVDMCSRYGARLDAAHESESDAIAACRCAWVLGTKGRVIRREANHWEAQEAAQLRAEWAAVRADLDMLHEAQRRWARGQAVSIRQHFEKLALERLRELDEAEHDALVLKARGVQEQWPMVPFDQARTRETA